MSWRENRREQQRNVATWQDLMFVCNVKKTVWWNWWLCHQYTYMSLLLSHCLLQCICFSYGLLPVATVHCPRSNATRFRGETWEPISVLARGKEMYAADTSRSQTDACWLCSHHVTASAMFYLMHVGVLSYKEPKCDRLHVTRSVTREKEIHVPVKLMTGYVIHGLLRLSGIERVRQR
jgi:hypothetical protein